MLRVSPYLPSGGPGNERTVMGNAAVGEELAGLDELGELYELNASDLEDEDEDDVEDDDDEDDEDEDEYDDEESE
jgi:hypothetical protein